MARTIIGIMTGADQRQSGHDGQVLATDRDHDALGAQLKANTQTDEFTKAQEVIEPSPRQATQMRPTPDFIWRTAKKDHTLGTENPVEVKAGEKIYLSIVQPTQSGLQNGSNDACPIFGGDRSKARIQSMPALASKWVSACGLTYGVVDHRANG